MLKLYTVEGCGVMILSGYDRIGLDETIEGTVEFSNNVMGKRRMKKMTTKAQMVLLLLTAAVVIQTTTRSKAAMSTTSMFSVE
jgi:hypothetical protein